VSFSDAELRAALARLSDHGHVSLLRTFTGELRILLAPELLDSLSRSILLEARRHPEGLGSLDEHRVIAGGYAFPEVEKFSVPDREALVDSAVALCLAHHQCVRETDALSLKVHLVFPDTISASKPPMDDDQLLEDAVVYTVTGAVESLYGRTVAALGYTNTFARTGLWCNDARYIIVASRQICGVRVEPERAGARDFVVYFEQNVDPSARSLFQALIESVLNRHSVAVWRDDRASSFRGRQPGGVGLRGQVGADSACAFCEHREGPVALIDGDTATGVTNEHKAELRQVARRSRLARAMYFQNARRMRG
jgi:hypothetical protein